MQKMPPSVFWEIGCLGNWVDVQFLTTKSAKKNCVAENASCWQGVTSGGVCLNVSLKSQHLYFGYFEYCGFKTRQIDVQLFYNKICDTKLRRRK